MTVQIAEDLTGLNLDPRCHQLHLAGMKTISIKELHAETGRWVRAAKKQIIIVTDRGEKVATLQPHIEKEKPRPVFTGRDWSKLPKIDFDSTEIISEERNHW